MELTKIKGVGPKTLSLLNKLNIEDIDDLIRYYPYRYNFYKPMNLFEVNEEDTAIISGTITSIPKVSYIKRNFNRLSFTFETNNINCNVAIFNRAYLSTHLSIGKQITLIGKYNKLKNSFTASDIKLYPLYKTEVEPVYHLVSGINRTTVKKCIDNALMSIDEVNEIVPELISDRYELMKTLDAIKEIHNPTTPSNLKKARIKLKYEELFEFMFKINLIKYKNQIFDEFVVKDITEDIKNDVLNLIPFDLTNDQLNAVNDIINDFKNTKRMNRLILGDVGSGKTIVSFIAVLLNYKMGYQSALLAPTEVLAKQHYDNFNNLFDTTGIKVELLTGSLTKKEKNNIIDKIKNNEVDLVIGTHAILEENVEFNNIGLVITDEQHRFGVNQRKSLQNKGQFVDVLYMSATPIPRTYALTIYGDMDISMIKEKPAGRKEIITNVYKFKDMNKIISEIEQELIDKHQVYIVAPLIEENEEIDLNDVNKIKEILETNLKGNYNIEIMHGKLKNVEKERVMNNFKEGTTNILISTTVIEVGVDVKNATVMAIFNAERFGLATLHQLRGRVGRNSLQSKCLLISDKETERLSVLEESNDGFYISEKDFEIRGSGDLFGIRQSGDMVFKIADLRQDFKILLQCKKDSEEFILDNIENNFANYSHYKRILQELMNND